MHDLFLSPKSTSEKQDIEVHGAESDAVTPNLEPAESTPEAFTETPRLLRLRRLVGNIAARLRLSRDGGAEVTNQAHVHDDTVDELGLSKMVADVASADPGSEKWLDIMPRRTGEFVKRAPHFLEQVRDTSRTNQIEYVNEAVPAIGTQTQGRETATASEHNTLVALRDFLDDAANYTNAQGEHSFAPLAASMTENLTFIGEREYDEAVAGIAESWRQRLQSTETGQILVSATVAEDDNSVIKSSAYLLDNIMKHFSDEELDEWRGRLIIDPSELTADPKDTSIVLLDDWTISGAQLQYSAQKLIDEYPDYRGRIEVQLVAASEERVRSGLKLDGDYSKVGSIPVNAYYAAHAANKDIASHSGAHITGAHCAVDYDFNDLMANMAATMGRLMPPGTNIVRPYRKPGYKLTQLQRLHS